MPRPPIRRLLVTAFAALLLTMLTGCTLPIYKPSGETVSQARLRVKVMDMYAYPATYVVFVAHDTEPKRQLLAVFQKPWMGIGKHPKESERIGMPESTNRDTNMEVIERFVSAGEPLPLLIEARLDGNVICGAGGQLSPAPGHDYEIVISMVGTSLGGNGRCGLLAYEIQPGNGPDNRAPQMLQPLAITKR